MVTTALKTQGTAVGSEDSAKQAYGVIKWDSAKQAYGVIKWDSAKQAYGVTKCTFYRTMLVLETNGQNFKASRQRRRYHCDMA